VTGQRMVAAHVVADVGARHEVGDAADVARVAEEFGEQRASGLLSAPADVFVKKRLTCPAP
jgi:hypothetical protein